MYNVNFEKIKENEKNSMYPKLLDFYRSNMVTDFHLITM